MTREEYLCKLEEEQTFLYFNLKPMDEERHNKWINHIFYLIKQEASKIFDEHETQLKAKEEQLEMFKSATETLTEVVLSLKGDSKARSIVAMLFWEWKKSIRESGDNTFYNDEFSDGNYWFVNAKEQSFKQAYKILKDTQ